MDSRLVLWDVDHTLIVTRGVGTEMYRRAFAEVTGRRMDHLAEVTGRTELAIWADTLRLHGIEPTAELERRYATVLARQYELHADELSRRGRPLPGAGAALDALAGRDDLIQSVLTGNLRAVAIIKLRTFGLAEHVDFDVGGYGDDHPERPKLVAVAQRRAEGKYGVAFDRSSTVLIGDSAQDIAAGQHGGAAVVAVASGRERTEQLSRAGAQLVLPDLTDTAAVVDAVLKA